VPHTLINHRLVQAYGAQEFADLLEQALVEVSNEGLDPEVSFSHVTGGQDLFHYAAVVLGKPV
jgi:hypothetical protein